MTHPHLERAPITEALLNITVDSDAAISVADQFAREVSDSYPDVLPVFDLEAMFEVREGRSAVSGSHRIKGRICWNESKTRAVQARVDGFTVNHVKQYESWQVLRAEAIPLWERYCGLFNPKSVTRLGLRYINRLRLPATGSLDQYMQTYPHIGPSLPQEMRNFLQRVELSFNGSRLAIITQTVNTRAPAESERDLLLDVDAVSMTEFDPRDPEMWVEFDHLREIKNVCFFGSLQDATWRKYQ